MVFLPPLVNFVVTTPQNLTMNKSTDYLGQPILSQLLSLIDKPIIEHAIKSHQTNYRYKKLFLWEHLVSMLYGVFTNCTSLRELQYGLEVCQGKLNHLNINRVPPRSTLSDGNKNRPSKVFATIYQKLYASYKSLISDSTLRTEVAKRLFILDSTTISLFKAILKPAGRKRLDGKSKGGMKVNTLLQAETQMPAFINYMAAALHDQQFYHYIKELPDNSIIVFDKAYINYQQFDAFTQRGIFYFTRQKDNACYRSIEEFELPENEQNILKDERIELSYKQDKMLQMRRVAVFSEKYNTAFVFITNNFELSATEIAAIYQNRWQIEVFFKKLKQNFPLTYFYGDNTNAVEIQIWCALIALLLLQVVFKEQKTKMAFSLLTTIVRLHIMNYVSLTAIIETYKKQRIRKKKNPDKPPQKIKTPPAWQLSINLNTY